MTEYFIMYMYKLNGKSTQDFTYSWGESAKEASERLFAKNSYIYETWVYDSADAYHRRHNSLYSKQMIERL